MTSAPPILPSTTPQAEIRSTRFFAVSRERLFAAFSQADQLVHWWGPEGFTNTFEDFDLRVGGQWRFIMHGPDGKDYANINEFTEVVPPSRIVFRHLEPIHHFEMVMDFKEAEGGSQLTWRMRFPTEEEAEKLRPFIIRANEENFDRLESNLAARPGADEWVFSCSFHAPPAQVFQAWTNAAMLAQWWGPHSFTNPVCDLDARSGGEYRIGMRSPEGEDYALSGRFVEVNEPTRLIFTMDCTGHPPAWHDLVKPGRTPEETNPAGIMWATVTFHDQGQRTALAIRIRFETSAIRDSFVHMGIERGWTESLESLAALLSPKQEE
ncbi:SRPBCC domain-containing protein [Prosthecobacter sp. SYSU 5D2]|uniref:SRPBCC domain-containing protein n=1 Tax=Prosthecobacter sp. SYSU 5D2 TaxID=3134134 RepID=UPI0031FF2133